MNWSEFAKPPKTSQNKVGYGSYREFVQKQQEKQEVVQEQQQFNKSVRPVLKKALYKVLSHNAPLEVVKPFNYLTESINAGVDGASTSLATQSVQEGSTLKFKALDKSLGKMIFENGNGEIVDIYYHDQIPIPSPGGYQSIPNEGLEGLLFNTNIYPKVVNKIKERQK